MVDPLMGIIIFIALLHITTVGFLAPDRHGWQNRNKKNARVFFDQSGHLPNLLYWWPYCYYNHYYDILVVCCHR